MATQQATIEDTKMSGHGDRAAAAARSRLLSHVPASEHRYESAGVSTAVLEAGEGPPIVLLHGPGEFAARWFRILPELATTHRVVAPDLPDHGSSELKTGELHGELVQTWLDELIDVTCPTPPVLVGHLLGGAIAARFAAAQQGRIDRLVLVDSFGLTRFWPSPGFGIALMRYLARPTERSYHRFMGQCLVDREAFDSELGEASDALRDYMLDRARAPRVKGAMKVLMKEVGVPRIPSAELARIDVRTTLIWGRQDRANRLRVAEAASAEHGWPLHVIDGAADDPPLEQPAAFLAALRLALDS